MEFLYIALLVLLDQVCKFFVKLKLNPNDNIDIIKGFFSFNYVRNQGAAFGIFSNKRLILIGITSVVVIAMIVYMFKNKNIDKWIKVCFIFIIAGAIGNLIDRVHLSYVVDFIYFHFKNHDLPVFNIADMCVVGGTIALAIRLIFAKE